MCKILRYDQAIRPNEGFLHLVGDHIFLSDSPSGEHAAQLLARIAREADCAVSGVQPTRESLLPYFAQVQLQVPHDYVVYIYRWHANEPGRPALHSQVDMHAGESETSHTMVSRPDLVHLDRVPQESGADQKRLNLLG